jgi:hypothetical protein
MQLCVSRLVAISGGAGVSEGWRQKVEGADDREADRCWATLALDSVNTHPKPEA